MDPSVKEAMVSALSYGDERFVAVEGARKRIREAELEVCAYRHDFYSGFCVRGAAP